MTERERAAIHEAGHGVAAVLLDVPFVCLVLHEDDGRWGGELQYTEAPIDAASLWTNDVLNELARVTPAACAVTAAGIVGECVLCQGFSWQDVVAVSGDLWDLETDVRQVHPDDGQARRLAVRAAFQQAEALLTEHRPALETVAAQLEARGRLSQADVVAVIRERAA